MAQVSLERVSKSFGDQTVVKDVNLTIDEGEFCVLLGPSGCGKSTLLRLIAGLEDVSSGNIRIAGEDVTRLAPKERDLAMVFQSYALYPHMTVFDNMAFGLRLRGRSRTQISQRVSAAAKALHIDHLLQRKPAALSGGQQQRVAIGRAIVREPRVFLFDEPLSNLDADLRVRMRLEFARLHRQLSATMIYVTHDQVEAMTLADRMVVIDNGRIAQTGTPLELYQSPRNLFVAGFIGLPRMNLIPVQSQPAATTQVKFYLPNGNTFHLLPDQPHNFNDDRLTLGIRPEHLRIDMAENDGIRGEVILVEQLGDHNLIYLNWLESAEPIVIKTNHNEIPRSGERINISFALEHCHLFDGRGRRLNVRHDVSKQSTTSEPKRP